MDPFITHLIALVAGVIIATSHTYHDLWLHSRNGSRGWVNHTSKRHFKVTACDCGEC